MFLYIGRRIREHETVKLKELNARKKTLLVNPRLRNVYFYIRPWAGDLNVNILTRQIIYTSQNSQKYKSNYEFFIWYMPLYG